MQQLTCLARDSFICFGVIRILYVRTLCIVTVLYTVLLQPSCLDVPRHSFRAMWFSHIHTDMPATQLSVHAGP
jgi:hypothetical protein